MSHVFISYKAEDRARVRPLVDALTAEGVEVWWDVQIEGGAAWRERIQHHLDSAACVIVVWSALSVGPEGHFVQDEASRARRRGLCLPVAIDPVEAPLGFGQDHLLKLVGWRGSRRDPRFQDILAAVRAMVSASPRPTPTAPGQAARAVGRRALLWPLAGLGGLALAGGGLWLGTPGRLCALTSLACGPAGGAAANSIAVLPFANESGDAAQDYFADGLTEEMIANLARIDGLQVVGRISAFRFKGSREGATAIGARLGVAWLLDGSVRREGPTVRVSAALVEARTGFERWSQTYDRPMADVFAIQSDIAGLVAEALKISMLGRGPSGATTADPKAHDAYLRGRALYNLGGDEATFRRALAAFDEAVAADPAYALAQAARARTLVFIGSSFAKGEDMRTLHDAGLAAAERAVSLAPDLALAQSALGFARANGHLDLRGAAEPYQRAYQLGSGDAEILFGYAGYQSYIGRPDLALSALKKAAVLDPLNPRVERETGIALYFARRYGEAIAAFRRALAGNPHMTYMHADIANSLILQGSLAPAQAEYAFEPVAWWRLVGESIIAARRGDTSAARAALARVQALHDDNTLYQQAEALAQVGDTDLALTVLERAYAAGDTGVLRLKTDPFLDPLRREPRFARLSQKLGFM